MRNMIIGAALLAFGSGAAYAQQNPNADITTPSTPAPTVNSPADSSMTTKASGMHKSSKMKQHRAKHGSMKKSM